MLHSENVPCPFQGYSHPRGSTCCSFDASLFAKTLQTWVSDAAMAFLCRDCDAEAALNHGLFLREKFINLMVFHKEYRERAGAWPEHPWSESYAEARSRGEEFPDWSFDEFAEVFEPIGQASEWFIVIGKHHFNVRALRSQPGRT